jgi:predicted nucleic acid-binding protein
LPWLLIGDDPQQTPIAEQAFLDALEQFRQGGDLADQLILARATNTGALPVLSFDRRFAASDGVELLRSS